METVTKRDMMAWLIWKNDSRLSDVRNFNVTEDNAPYLHIWRQMVISTFEMDFDVNIVLNDTIPNRQLDLT